MGDTFLVSTRAARPTGPGGSWEGPRRSGPGRRPGPVWGPQRHPKIRGACGRGAWGLPRPAGGNTTPRAVTGTVYDDIAGGGCIPVSQCHCKLHGRLYAPGRQVTNDCEHWWVRGPGWGPGGLGPAAGPDPVPTAPQRVPRRPLGVQRPAVPRDVRPGGRVPHHHLRWEEVHLPRGLLLRAGQGGQCRAAWAELGTPPPPAPSLQPLSSPQGDHNDSYALLGELAPCGSTDKQTCLKTVVLLADRKKNVGAPSPPRAPRHPRGPRGPSQPRCPLGLSCRWWPSSLTAACCSTSCR